MKGDYMKDMRIPASVLVAASLLVNPVYALEIQSRVDHEKVRLSVSAAEILGESSNLRGQINQALKDQKVIDELAKMGVAPREVEGRLAAMTDSELQQIQNGVDRHVGGDAVVIGTTTLLLIIIIIILIA
jgi:predicted neutral ceramidase superfamily lipid hydrolase